MSCETDIRQPESITDQRDAVLETLDNHLDDLASVVAELRDESYGKLKLRTDGALWTMKHEKGSVEWFRREEDNDEVYLISTKGDPEPRALAEGLTDYPEFIERANEWVDGQDSALEEQQQALEDVSEEIDTLEESAESLQERRDEVEAQFWDLADRIADKVSQIKDDKYATLIFDIDYDDEDSDEERWKLKADSSGASYLQVDGTYVLGNDSPRPYTLTKTLQKVDAWIAEVNDWLDRRESGLQLNVTVEEIENDDN